ncbi:hypothetical protein HUJ04_009772 [Dendroctonus ponderosae]|nr:hypothetical protein HUJ04_009772 [Dendroctonus ponderosae]
MVFLNKSSRHSEWRKTAKKLRRKRIRQAKAKARDAQLREVESQPEYQQFLRRQEKLETEQAGEEQRQAAEREAQWRKVEEEAQEQWRKLQERLAQAKDERLKQNLKIRLEWEREQEKLKEIQLEKERKLEEERAQQEKHVKELLDFLEQGGDTPEHLKRTMETNPGKKPCPFFQKVCACRFFDTCSRNHIRPGVSSTLLITNFFTHISLEVKENEHGSDSSLEFEKEDTFKYYKDFFYDVILELEKCGKIRRFVTCCNHEPHLRGNVYIQYETTREALSSYHKFNGSFYAGKQLNGCSSETNDRKGTLAIFCTFSATPEDCTCTPKSSMNQPGEKDIESLTICPIVLDIHTKTYRDGLSRQSVPLILKIALESLCNAPTGQREKKRGN